MEVTLAQHADLVTKILSQSKKPTTASVLTKDFDCNRQTDADPLVCLS
jgi:hypothetical protein